MNRAVAVVILLLLAAATARVWVTGQYVSYVKAGLWPLLAISVVLIALFATAKGHQPRVAWLLLVPVLALLLISPQSLGSYAASNAGTVLTQADEYPPLPDGDPVELKVFDYASRAVFDSGRTLHGRRVRLVGFTSTGPGGERLLVRMILTCCAADGRPVKIAMRHAEPLPDDTWVEVVGSYVDGVVEDDVNGARIPFVEMADRLGRWKVFLAGHVVLVLAYVLIAVSWGGWGVAAVVLLAHGLFYACTDGVLMAYVGPLVPESVRATGLAFVQTGQALARAAGAVVFGVLATGVSVAPAFGVFAAVLAVVVVVGVRGELR